VAGQYDPEQGVNITGIYNDFTTPDLYLLANFKFSLSGNRADWFAFL